MVVKVLGPLETGTEPLSPRERAVLSALVVRLGSTVPPADLAAAWWGESPPRTWEQQVRNSVARIRARLGRESIESAGGEYRLGLDSDAIDATRFERLVSAARSHSLRGEHDRAIDAYTRALSMWRGTPLQDVADWEPGVVEALRLTEIRASAEEELLDARLASGEHRSVIADAERLLREEPLREDRWAIVALANYRADRQAEALSVVRAARERLADELGIEPGARLASLELAMLRRDPSLDAPAPAPVTASACPYPGLRAFGPDDAEVFFGRDDDIEAVLDRLSPGAVVTIAGASGTGKSSVLLAGVLPRLRARGRIVDVIRPGSGGIAAVRRAVERAHVLAIDQAEELLAATDDDIAQFSTVAQEFVERGGALVVTVRSEALDRSRALPGLGDRIGRGVYLLGALTDAAFRSAIEEPARRAGLTLEPGLVELAVRDGGDRAATLPHLSHAMQETWARREGATLTVDAYRESGGIPGAIAQSAEDAFRLLDPAGQELCRSLMLRLLDRGTDGVSTRRRVPAEPLLADPARRRMLERLTQARLVTLDGDAVVVAHEAIATAWPRLDAWLEADADGARILRAVESAAAAWDASGRDDDDLLRGARLHAALDWRDASHPDLTPVEHALLTASADREQRDMRELTARAGRDRRRNRVLGSVLVAAILAGTLATVRGFEAAEAAENARIEALVATSLSLRANDRGAAALLAAEAFRRWPDDGRVRSALLGVVTSAGGLLDTHRVPGADHSAITMIPGTGTALRVRDGEAGTALEIVEVATGEVRRTLDVDVEIEDRWLADYRDVAVSGDGRVGLVQSGTFVDAGGTSACCWNQVTFIDLETGEELPGSQLLRHRTSITVDLGPDGAVAYLQHPINGALIAVDAVTGEVRASSSTVFDDYTGEPGRYDAVAVVDGDTVVTAVEDRVDVFDRQTLSLERSIPLELEAGGESLTPDGLGGVVSAGRGGIARVDLDSGEVTWSRAVLPSDICYGMVLTAGGSVVCASLGRVSEIDPLTGGATYRTFSAQVDDIPRLSVIDDRTVLLDVTGSALWMRWRLDGSGAGVDHVAPGQRMWGSPSPDGRFITTQPIAGGPMELWDVASASSSGVESDGLTLLSDDIVEYYVEGEGFGLQNLVTGARHPYRIPGLPDDFMLIDGGWGPLAFVAFDDQIIAFDPTTGEPVGAPLNVPDATFSGIASVSESPDGTHAMVNWADNAVGHPEAGVFRLSDGALIDRGLTDRDYAIFTPSGEILATANESVERIDSVTLQPISTLPRAEGGSQLLVASLDERTLLNVGWDNQVRLYDLTRDIPLGDAIDADTEGGPTGGQLTADGSLLLTNSGQGVLMWDLRPEAQAQSMCALAGRELTAEEWNTYFPGEEQVATCALLAQG